MEYKWKAWSVTSVGGLMASIDSTIVTLALVPIDQELQTSYVLILWVVISYLLVNTALVLSFGRMADMLGRKNMYNLGFVIFTIGSALCGFATTGLLLVVYRVVQGIGGAFLIANSMAIITEAFPPHERGKAFGYNAIIWAVGSITGVALGGIIITFTSTWRWIFYINVPIGIFGTIWAYATLHQDKVSSTKESFDLPAATSFTLMLMFLLIGITLGLLSEWKDPAGIVLMSISPLFLIFFLVWELKFSQNPIIPFSMFRNRVFSLSIVTVAFQSLALFSVNFLLVFYFEGIAGLSPLMAAILIIPMSVVNAFVGPFAGKWSDRIGARIVATIGLLIQFGVLVILSTLSTSIPLVNALWEIGILEALFGLGGGFFYPANTSTVMSSSPPGRFGVTSGILATFRNTGMILSFVVSMIVVTSAINQAYVYQLFLGTLAGSLPPDVGANYLVGQGAAFRLSAILILVAAFFSMIRGKLPPHAVSSVQYSGPVPATAIQIQDPSPKAIDSEDSVNAKDDKISFDDNEE
ncbi:MAG TPA: MFS transporter [Candidatus Lokiarchaeia archaeon]|nr:MFS transporter [Candidatus Lokiarchaeia archaeon]